MSYEDYVTQFKLKKDKKHTPCASHLQDLPMHGLSEIVGEVGGYRVSTPASIGEYQQPKLSE